MARSRAQSSAETPKEPHSVSLKVLRLSRPSLAERNPLPTEDPRCTASLAYPSPSSDHQFALAPILTLPPAFGTTHVGETFACSLCANNEIAPGEVSRVVTSIKVSAEMQTPSQSVPLELHSSPDEDEDEALQPGQSKPRIIRYDLKEEGNHVLAVDVTYSEAKTTSAATSFAPGGRIRTFRKLYQFLAQPCLSVRTKATELPAQQVEHQELEPHEKGKLLRFALEAQLENVTDTVITLEPTSLEVRPPFKAISLNADLPVEGQPVERPTLSPRDVLQIAYLVEQPAGVTDGLEALRADLKRDGKTSLGQLSIGWRGPMGEPGFLTTGNLLTRRVAA